MKKSDRIQEMALVWKQRSSEIGLDSRYIGYFELFNLQQYYEAHDVLEDLWLEQGKSGENYGFFKGLIQLAGAFVHLQKNRLRPAGALFRLSRSYLSKYPDDHFKLNLIGVFELIEMWESSLVKSPGANPLRDFDPPQLRLTV